MSAPRHLDELVPGLVNVVRPVDLVERPTPVTPEPALAERWGLGELWLKRDDLTSSIYGGSKVRNLEFFFGAAKGQGATEVATMGPLGSHQVLAMATFGAHLGMRTRALLVPQNPVREVAVNERLLPALGMEVIRCKSFAQVPLGYLRVRLTRRGSTYWIPSGSKHPLGVLGVVEGVLELAQSIRNGELPCPDDVVVPTGTCATAAGIYLGLALAELPVRTVAVRMVPMMITGSAKLKKLAAQTVDLMRKGGYRGEPRYGDVLWVDDYARPGYSKSNPGAEEAMEDVAELGDFRTELTYTGKSLAYFAAGNLAGRRVVFWNTYSAVDPDPGLVPAEPRG
ncbi:MAG TPA: pyridoxal-phosphate dependent enzyme [Stellaceae bacterium]|jgi:D-cysteine desulfhydrase|nr:pyridoxal-phosphate dependent enzyme [Stellaceae bacterium]